MQLTHYLCIIEQMQWYWEWGTSSLEAEPMKSEVLKFHLPPPSPTVLKCCDIELVDCLLHLSLQYDVVGRMKKKCHKHFGNIINCAASVSWSFIYLLPSLTCYSLSTDKTKAHKTPKIHQTSVYIHILIQILQLKMPGNIWTNSKEIKIWKQY